MDNPIYERRTPDQSTWQGRRRKGEQDVNSFAAFVASAKRTKNGQAHLQRHHRGFGL